MNFFAPHQQTTCVMRVLMLKMASTLIALYMFEPEAEENEPMNL